MALTHTQSRHSGSSQQHEAKERFRLGWCNWLVPALALIVAVAFNPLGSQGFETVKMTLVRVAALLLIVGLVVERWWAGLRWPLPARSAGGPLIVAGVLYLVATALATVGSVEPLNSVLGSYDRIQGLVSILALEVVALTIALGRVQPWRLVDTLIVSTIPVCGYALIQQVGLDHLPWLDRTPGPHSTVGSSTALGGYLATVVPLTLTRATRTVDRLPGNASACRLLCLRGTWLSAALFVLTMVQAAVILTTGVRGALLGLATGVVIVALMLIRRRPPRISRRALLAVMAVLATGAIALSLRVGTVESIRSAVPQVTRLTELGPDDTTARERLLIWQATIQHTVNSGPRLVLGFGPETQALALEAVLPLELANRLPDLRFDRVHNEALDHLLTRGLLGLGAYLGLIGAALHAGLRKLRDGSDTWLPAALLAALGAHIVEVSFAFSTATTLLLFWLIMGLLAAPTRPPVIQRGLRPRYPMAVILLMPLLATLPLLGSPLLGDLAYTRALAYGAGEDLDGQVVWLRRAVAIAPDRVVYRVALGNALAAQAAQEPREEWRIARLDEAVAVLSGAVDRFESEPYTWFHLGQALELRAEAQRVSEAWSEAAVIYDQAARLSPNRSLFRDSAGLSLSRAGRFEEALARYAAAEHLQGADAERTARIGDCLLALNRPLEAAASYETALGLAPRSAPAHAGLAAIWAREGQVDRALDALRQATRFQSREWRYHEQLAILASGVGRSEEAYDAARAAARVAPPWERERLRALAAEQRRIQ